MKIETSLGCTIFILVTFTLTVTSESYFELSNISSIRSLGLKVYHLRSSYLLDRHDIICTFIGHCAE